MARKSGGGEYTYHIVGVRSRVTGAGNLRMTLEGLDNVRSLVLVPVPMIATNPIEPTRLANFQAQRTRLVGRVTELNEWFQIRRIIIFAKPVAAELPNGGT